MKLSPSQEKLVLDLVTRDNGLLGGPPISLDEFCARWPIEPSRAVELGCSLLEHAVREKDARAAASGFMLAKHFGTAVECLPTILALAPQPWHHAHEDIVFFLADLRLPECLSVFEALVHARFDYLAWDDNRALAVKCIWGMGKLGSEEAVASLEAVMHGPEPILSRNAAYQLERISQGEDGAGGAAAVRAAQALLGRPPQAMEED